VYTVCANTNLNTLPNYFKLCDYKSHTRPHSQSHTPNYFKLLNVPQDYNINLTQLKQNYKALQTNVHPDKNVNKSEEEQVLAAQQSADINFAYYCLKDKWCRAKHLLALKGKVFDEHAQINDLAFLGDIIDFNDELESCEDFTHLRQFKIQNEEGIIKLFELFEESLAEGDLDNAMECLMKTNFLRQNRARLDEKVDEVNLQ